MSSPSRIAANRRNAVRSTGPRTAAGKIRASGNARKHGLSISIRYEPGISNKIEALTMAIAGKDAPPRRLQAARDVAEAEFELRRFQNFKLSLIEVSAADMCAIAKIVGEVADEVDDVARKAQDVVLNEMRTLTVLSKLERYERRALSKQWRALNKYAITLEENEM